MILRKQIKSRGYVVRVGYQGGSVTLRLDGKEEVSGATIEEAYEELLATIQPRYKGLRGVVEEMLVGEFEAINKAIERARPFSRLKWKVRSGERCFEASFETMPGGVTMSCTVLIRLGMSEDMWQDRMDRLRVYNDLLARALCDQGQTLFS